MTIKIRLTAMILMIESNEGRERLNEGGERCLVKEVVEPGEEG